LYFAVSSPAPWSTAPIIATPRSPLAGEVRKYDLSHLRRLDVTPGITGLWQVQEPQDLLFASYVLLDVTYIDNWSIWLDFKIIARTIAAVFAGGGAWRDRFRDPSCVGQGELHRFSALLSSSSSEKLERQRQALLPFSVFPLGVQTLPEVSH
jgi:hypothetical protein